MLHAPLVFRQRKHQMLHRQLLVIHVLAVMLCAAKQLVDLLLVRSLCGMRGQGAKWPEFHLHPNSA